jgi:YggT family protein
MFVVSNFLVALAQILELAVQVYWWILLGRVIVSWVNADRYNPIVRFLYTATEPVLYRVRRVIPATFGGVDFSPIIVLLGLVFLETFIVGTIRDIAMQLR